MARKLRTLLFSTLYPSSVRPGHGIFVETRLRELLKEGAGDIETRVLAPVPWFPSTHARHGDYAAMARTPRRERHNGIDVMHPRYLVVPKIGMHLAPATLAAAALRSARSMVAEGFDFDLIDAHYFYPDGVAAAVVARAMGKPLVITARGSDINLIAEHALPRNMMRWAARQASACVGVSQALVDAMAALGMPAERLHMLRNGVDLQRFSPQPQPQARAAIGFDGSPLLLSVGNLVPLKGHVLCIDALAELLPLHPQARLLIAGAGPERERLLQHAQARGVGASVNLIGAVPNAGLAAWYSAADFLLLASSREGWPNVLLEAMACGTPAIATRVGGVPEVMRHGAAGRLIAERTGTSLAAAVLAGLASGNDRAATRSYAEGFGWAATSRQQLEIFGRIATRVGEGVAQHA